MWIKTNDDYLIDTNRISEIFVEAKEADGGDNYWVQIKAHTDDFEYSYELSRLYVPFDKFNEEIDEELDRWLDVLNNDKERK